MNTDIRLKTALRHHRKIKRLVNRLGAVAPWNLIQLWLSASENRPEGILTGYTVEDIADDADWQGDPNTFVNALLECKWLDELEDGTYALHDWKEHQPYVSHSEDRSEQARHAARTRWAKQGACSNDAHLCSEHTGSIQSAYGQHTDSNADFEMSNAPSPSPDPSPTPKPKPKTAAAVVDRSKGRSRAREGTALAAAAAFETPPDPPSSPPEPETVQELPPLALIQPEPEILPPEPVLATEPPVSSPPDDGHMHLNEAANLYRQCFAGKNHLQVAPMVLAKLGVLISQYSRDEMQSAFEAAATAGANSLAYLEKTLEGKRADAQGHPRGKPHGRQGEAMRNLAAWAKGDWLREEIATGMARLLADGKREGMPSADLIAVTAENYRESLTPYQLTEEERPRVREMFEQVRKQCRNWPQSKELTDFLPRRRMQDVLPEETQRGSPEVHLWDEFLKQKQA